MNNKTIISDLDWGKIQEYGDSIAQNLAIECRKALVKKTRDSIIGFYSSYTPRDYEREWQLFKICTPHYTKGNSGHIFHGGVIINSSKMHYEHPSWHDEPDYILEESLRGVHGEPDISYTPRWILNNILVYRDYIYHKISGNDSISRVAIAKSNIF